MAHTQDLLEVAAQADALAEQKVNELTMVTGAPNTDFQIALWVIKSQSYRQAVLKVK